MFARLIIAFFLVLFTSPHSVKSETIPVYGNAELQPLHFEGPDGQTVGFWVDILEKLSDRLAVQFEQNLIGVRQGREKIINTGEKALLGVILEASKSFERYKDFVFSKPIANFHLRFYSLATDGIIWRDLSNIHGKVAVIGLPGAFATQWLKQQVSEELELVPVSSFKEGIEKLITSEADAFLGSEWAIRYAYNQYFQSSIGLIEGPVVYSTGMALATHSTQSELITKINEVFRNPVFVEEVKNIYFKWLPRIPLSPQEYLNKKIDKRNNFIVIFIVFITILFLLLSSYILYLRLRQKAKIQEVTSLAIRSTLHDLADPLNMLVSERSVAPLLRESAFQHINALMQYHRMLLVSGGKTKWPKQTAEIGHFFNENANSLQALFKISAKLDLHDKDKSTSFQTHLNGIQIILYNIFKNCFDHGEDELYIKIRINDDKDHTLCIDTFNKIKVKEKNPYKYDNKINFNQHFRFGLKIIEDISILLNGKFTTSVKGDLFQTSLHLPIRLIDERAQTSSKVMKIDLRNTLGLVIVDDSRYTLHALEDECNNIGIKCWTLVTGDELMAFCAENSRSVMNNYRFLIDKNLADQSGIDAIKQLREEFSVRPENVALMTGEVSDLMVNGNVNELRGIKILQKPFRLTDHLED